MRQADIYSLLPIGKHNAISSYNLMMIAGYSSKRELLAEIRRERLEGALILASKGNKGGFYRHANEAELREWYCRAAGDAEAIFKTLQTAQSTLQRYAADRGEYDRKSNAYYRQLSVMDFLEQKKHG